MASIVVDGDFSGEWASVSIPLVTGGLSLALFPEDSSGNRLVMTFFPEEWPGKP
jgi:hypothetical protein